MFSIITENQSWGVLCHKEGEILGGEPGCRHTATAMPYEHPALTHAAHSPKTPLHDIAIYRARVISLKELALVLGTAVGVILRGFSLSFRYIWDGE